MSRFSVSSLILISVLLLGESVQAQTCAYPEECYFTQNFVLDVSGAARVHLGPISGGRDIVPNVNIQPTTVQVYLVGNYLDSILALVRGARGSWCTTGSRYTIFAMAKYSNGTLFNQKVETGVCPF